MRITRYTDPQQIKELRSIIKTINENYESHQHEGCLNKNSTEPPFIAHGNQSEINRITKIAETLSKSPTGATLLQTAYKNKYTILLQRMSGAFGYCDPEKKIVVLNANYSDEQNIGTLAHELTHVNQFTNNMGSLDDINVKTFFMETRIMEADAETRAGLVLTELKELGIDKPWECFINDSPTVAQGFIEAQAKEGFATDEAKSKVLTNAFKAWYKNTSIKVAYDRDCVDFLKETLIKDEKLNLKQEISPKQMIKTCCQLKPKLNYFTDNPSILLKPKYLGITQTTLNALKKFMKEREEKQNLPYDHSIDAFPVITTNNITGQKKIIKSPRVTVHHFLKSKQRN